MEASTFFSAWTDSSDFFSESLFVCLARAAVGDGIWLFGWDVFFGEEILLLLANVVEVEEEGDKGAGIELGLPSERRLSFASEVVFFSDEGENDSLFALLTDEGREDDDGEVGEVTSD